MLDLNTYRFVQEHDFLLLPALELRKYEWASLEVYTDLVRSRLSHYRSKYDLLGWFKFWTEDWRLVSPFAGKDNYEQLKETSSQCHDKALKRIFSSYKDSKYIHQGYDIWNALDLYIIFEQQLDIGNILDFGAGYGRLGLVLGQNARVKNYLAIDSVELSYMLQNLTLSISFPEKFYEYIEYEFERKAFIIDLHNQSGIYHLPTWKWDLVPDSTLDLIIAVFVLPEINEFALKEFIQQSSRTLKVGGHIYIRDHLYTTGKNNHKGAHQLNTEDLLKNCGFQVSYQSGLVDNKDIYGIPRIYQYLGTNN